MPTISTTRPDHRFNASGMVLLVLEPRVRPNDRRGPAGLVRSGSYGWPLSGRRSSGRQRPSPWRFASVPDRPCMSSATVDYHEKHR
jgi:hypothetical protein